MGGQFYTIPSIANFVGAGAENRTKEFCMKNFIKLLGIIALVAVIGSLLAACDKDTLNPIKDCTACSGTGYQGYLVNARPPEAVDFVSTKDGRYYVMSDPREFCKKCDGLGFIKKIF
jgi:putative NIF3 family GTP cyclohydrolase 1 type 2